MLSIMEVIGVCTVGFISFILIASIIVFVINFVSYQINVLMEGEISNNIFSILKKVKKKWKH